MKEFLLIIRTEGSVWTDLSPEKLQNHLKNGKTYIDNLVRDGKLKGANPIDKGSKILTQSGGGMINETSYNDGKEVLAGYFHITAKDMDEAVSIARANPIFKDISTKIEIYPMMAVGGN